MKNFISITLVLLVATVLGYAQTATPTTTLAAAMSMSDQTVNLTSSTGVTAAGLSPVTGFYVDREYMTVSSNVSGNVWTVKRAVGGQKAAHASGATIYVAPLSLFDSGPKDRTGVCTGANFQYLPLINVRTGNAVDCVNSAWQIVNGPAASNVGVTAFGPNAAGTVDVGSSTLGFRYHFIAGDSGTPGTNRFKLTGTATAARTLTLPDATDTLAGIGATQTLTNKTLTGAIVTDTAKASAQFDAVTGTTGTTLTNVTGMVVTVVPGTYRFYINLPGVATANSGIKAGFKLTTTVLTSLESTARAFTASAVVVQHTTTATDQATLIGSTTAAISTVIEGTMVVGTGGTIQVQAAQNAAHADTTSVYVGASMTFTRIL